VVELEAENLQAQKQGPEHVVELEVELEVEQKGQIQQPGLEAVGGDSQKRLGEDSQAERSQVAVQDSQEGQKPAGDSNQEGR